MLESRKIVEMLRDARARTLRLVEDLSDEQLIGPRLAIVNPLLWEIGHVSYFQEFWTLRHLHGRPSLLEGSDQLYDSARIAHDTRWDLPLPSRQKTLDYMRDVLSDVIELLEASEMTSEIAYFHQLALFHEDMHDEAFTYTRQTLGYPTPRITTDDPVPTEACSGEDVELPGGTFQLGAEESAPFVFDNEKWAHSIEVRPFRISRTAVSEGEFGEFVEAGGYEQDDLWSADGLAWRNRHDARTPLYWERRQDGSWARWVFDQLQPLDEGRAMIHVNAWEAEAFSRWAGRRLPTETEWEFAAALNEDGTKRKYPWGNESPIPEHGNLDGRHGWTVDVASFPAGDTPSGIRQMFGNVWEWTSTRFLPYPGFEPDPYQEYSAPWFERPHRVLRGGAWTTRSRMLRNTWRNFYEPHRRDVLAGFRTCAIK